MKLLYVDESHDKKTYALCGFLINDINYRKLNADFNVFLKKEFGMEEDQELKGDELFNGRNFWKDTKLDERNEIVCKIIEFLKTTKGTNFMLACSEVQKENQHELYFILLEAIIEKSASIVSKLGKTNRQLLIVFDERQDFRKDNAVYYLRVPFSPDCRSGDKLYSLRSFNINSFEQEFRWIWVVMVIREKFGQGISECDGRDQFGGSQTRAYSAHPGTERTPDQI